MLCLFSKSFVMFRYSVILIAIWTEINKSSTCQPTFESGLLYVFFNLHPSFGRLSSLCMIRLKPEKKPLDDRVITGLLWRRDSVVTADNPVTLIWGNTEWRSNKVDSVTFKHKTGEGHWMKDAVSSWVARSVCHIAGGRSSLFIGPCMAQNTCTLRASQKSQLSIELWTMWTWDRDIMRVMWGRDGESLHKVEFDVLAHWGEVFGSITAHLYPYIKCSSQVGLWIEKKKCPTLFSLMKGKPCEP